MPLAAPPQRRTATHSRSGRPVGGTVLKKLSPTALGAKHAEHKVWRLPKTTIHKLKLEQRIVADSA